jgi:hypothetical protein
LPSRYSIYPLIKYSFCLGMSINTGILARRRLPASDNFDLLGEFARRPASQEEVRCFAAREAIFAKPVERLAKSCRN